MDDKDRDVLGGGALGGALGFAVGGPPGAAAGAAVGGWLLSQEDTHDATLRRAFYAVAGATGPEARLYVEGIDPDAAKPLSPGALLDDVDAAPDMVVVTGDGTGLVVEVTTLADVESDPDAVLARLEDVRAADFRRVLVVPDGAVEAVGEWLHEQQDEGTLAGSMTVTTPAGLADEV